MKKKVFKILTIIIVICLSIFCLNKALPVKADSGWDSDYDSGSDWGSDSGWDSDSGSDWDSDSSGSMSLSDFISIMRIFAVIIVVIILFSKKNAKNSNESYEETTEEEIFKIIPNFDIKEFEKKAYQIFYDVQMGWMKFDYDKLRKLLSDELYNTYLMDLEALKVKNQKNIMKDFELIESKMFKLEEENNTYIAKVTVEVEFIDYVEDSKTHEVLRGSNSKKLHNTYILTFIRSKSEIKNNKKCPKCGAPIKGNNSSKCEYCKSKIINDNYDWVMSNKEKISQKWGSR